MKKLALLMAFGWILGAVALVGASNPPKDTRKHTKLAKYVTAAEAYDKWQADPGKVQILDVRTPEEYAFVGHAPMAHNIPSRLWAGKWDAQKGKFVLKENLDFVAQVKKQFPVNATILVMCRSGHRSAAAVNQLAEAGFTNIYNIIDGFEGDMVKEKNSPQNGKRMVNGWKNSHLPWTYSMTPDLIYDATR